MSPRDRGTVSCSSVPTNFHFSIPSEYVSDNVICVCFFMIFLFNLKNLNLALFSRNYGTTTTTNLSSTTYFLYTAGLHAVRITRMSARAGKDPKALIKRASVHPFHGILTSSSYPNLNHQVRSSNNPTNLILIFVSILRYYCDVLV